jgi:beta-phosphoglucomutase
MQSWWRWSRRSSSRWHALTCLSAAGVPVAIVTGAQWVDVELVLARSALGGAFRAIVTEEDVQSGKPDPEGFHLAASALESNPAAILVFEDSIPGIGAAKAAGMLCVGVEETLPKDQLGREADAAVSGITPTLFASLA